MYSSCNPLSAPALTSLPPIPRQFSSLASISSWCVSKQPFGLIVDSRKLQANSRTTSLSSTIAHGKVNMSSASEVITDNSSAVVEMEEADENIAIFSLDPSLEAYKDHFKYRIRTFRDRKGLIEKHEGSLEEFAQGHSYQ
ncbi:hypothetical protein SASPL_135136 [Salvia splendens]|uniref:Uncharacterized protein n=1 Tax=Salvia splendens TaxID=180675 RepID=A0A8X8WY27_SALSN|nr:hypothetical protein SASPL_135136 [Salvia splendens]